MVKRKPLSKQIRIQILARDNYRCKMCGRTKDEVALEVDHILSVADGGTDELNNLATLCRDCNRGKAAYHFSDYANMNVLPEGIENHFKFYHDDKHGDFEQYHLYLYYKEGIHSEKYYHSWQILGSEYDSASDPMALENKRKAEESVVFCEKILSDLINERKRLIIIEEALYKV